MKRGFEQQGQQSADLGRGCEDHSEETTVVHFMVGSITRPAETDGLVDTVDENDRVIDDNSGQRYRPKETEQRHWVPRQQVSPEQADKTEWDEEQDAGRLKPRFERNGEQK